MQTVQLGTYPRQIAAFEISKMGEKIVGVYMLLKKDFAGLQALIRAVEDNAIILKHFNIDSREGDNGWVVSGFLDVCKFPYGISGLEAFLKRLSCVEKLVVSEHPLFLYQTSLFPAMNGNERVIIQSVERMHWIRAQLEKILTPAGASVIFYNMGVENGRGLHKMFTVRLQADHMQFSEKLELLRNHMISTGMGILDFRELDLITRWTDQAIRWLRMPRC